MAERRRANRPANDRQPDHTSAEEQDRRETDATAPHEPAMPQRRITGVIGDSSPTVGRSGEDTRRRGWFWHWNSLVTQYAPLIGLKGVGLINSYTVWTDRREQSPHRGFAFPSQQREADFYGEDRAELITINKILVALDLIEIRKEMVLRTDAKGRRWRVPHNLYRVKDHGDGFNLTTGDVMRVVELADKDRAVYRYVRQIFSEKFAPIDPTNAWNDILQEVRRTPVWQKLAAKTVKDEQRASARSRAGHASRRATSDKGAFSLPKSSDNGTAEPTDSASGNDSGTVEKEPGMGRSQTSVAQSNTGSSVDVDASNKGFAQKEASGVHHSNTGQPTSVDPGNTTYYQDKTTTTTSGDISEVSDDSLMFEERIAEKTSVVSTPPPDDSRDEDRAITIFEEANSRKTTAAERRLLRNLATTFTEAASRDRMTGWTWVALAIDDAVAAGSAFVAPKRIREILSRWDRDGMPEEYAANESAVTSDHDVSQSDDSPVTTPANASHKSDHGLVSHEMPEFDLAGCGMTSRQLWSAVLHEIALSGRVGRADLDTWLRDGVVLQQAETGELVIGVPHALAQRRVGRFVAPVRRAIAAVSGLDVDLEFVVTKSWLVGEGESPAGDPRRRSPRRTAS